MTSNKNPMSKFNFLIGDWDLKYQVPKSKFSDAMTGSGTGTFSRGLNDRVVYFDYQSLLKGEKTTAHGVFVWDRCVGIYHFHWFESTGHFMTANCDFPDDQTLYLNWHDSLLVQTFKKTGPNEVILLVEHPNHKGGFESVMKVILTKAKTSGTQPAESKSRKKSVKK